MYFQPFQSYLELFEPREAYVSELRLQNAWKEALWKKAYISCEGKDVRVLSPGKHNFSDGPDFLDARLYVGEKLYAGDVEIHHRVGDWYAHGHHRNSAYNRCVLHVVFHPAGHEMKTHTQGGHAIPICYVPLEDVFSLSAKEPCIIYRADPTQYFTLLEQCGWRRVEEKINYFYRQHVRFPYDVMLFWGVFKACGYRYNEDNMIQLFMAFPWEDYCACRILEKDIKPLLFALAGFSNSQLNISSIRWTYSRTRPAQFPDRRIAWLADMLAINSGEPISEVLYKKLSETEAWDDIFEMFFASTENSPGRGIRGEIILNTLLPLMEAMRLAKKDEGIMKHRIQTYISCARTPGVYGLVQAFHEHHGIKREEKRQKNWLSSQGVLYVRDHFCAQGLQSCCPVCMLGNTQKTPSGAGD